MSKLSQYYAEQIRKALGSGEANGITKDELMKRLQITDGELMDAVLKEAGKEVDICCRNGKYFLHDTLPKEVRDLLRNNFSINGIEHR